MPDPHPTLLRMPPWLGYPEERELPQPPEAYTVQQLAADWWAVVESTTGEWIYTGLGPVEVVRSPAPF